MDEAKRKARYQYRMERKALPEARKKGILRVRLSQLKFRRAIRKTTPEEWRRKLQIAQFKELARSEKTIYH